MALVQKEFSPDKYVVTFQVVPEEDNMRLDLFIKEYFTSFSREFVKQKIFNGDIEIKNREGKIKPNSKIHCDNIIVVTTHKKNIEDEYWKGEKIKHESPTVIFEDSDILVCSKPPFMATHPTGHHLFYCANLYFQYIHKHFFHTVHRLDRETSGVLVLTKNPDSANKITTEFENSRVKKCYFLISKLDVTLPPATLPFTARERLGPKDKVNDRIKILIFPPDSTDGRSAQTYFESLHVEKNYLLSIAFPKTGRQHQIRCHAKTHNFPILGDKIYHTKPLIFQRFKDQCSTAEDFKFLEIPRHALHSYAINFNYQDKEQTFFSKIPDDLKRWIKTNLTVDIIQLEKNIEKIINTQFAKTDFK